jgi:hypothetical protein
MVPGLAERDRSTIHEQWVDWWRTVNVAPGRCELHRVNANARWAWRSSLLWRSGASHEQARSGRVPARQMLRREVLTGS